MHWPPLRYPLDHIFASRHFRLASLRRIPDIGSDHFPVLAEFVFDPIDLSDASLALEDSEAGAEELEEAQERIAIANKKLEAEREHVETEIPSLAPERLP